MRSLRALAVALLTLLTFAQTVHAALYTGNLAGRPIGGDASTSCQGLAYGKFNGVMVLFTAAHCRGTSGTDVYGPTGTAIGYWTVNQAGWPKDLTYIQLYSGNWPSVQNIVYSNNGSGGFTIVTDPSSSLSCANHANYSNNVPIYEAWQSTSTSTYGTNNGITDGVLVYGNCGTGHPDDVETTVPQHTTNGWKDSGAPFILSGYTHTVFAVATEGGQSRTCSLAALRRTHRTSRRREQRIPLSYLDVWEIVN